ncbi:MAG: hypothetical protein U0795_00865 [Pirellulales bacterium]
MGDQDLMWRLGAAIVGSVGGALVGIAGGIGGDLARQGKNRPWIGVSLSIVSALGVITLLAAIVGVLLGREAFTFASLFVVGVSLIVVSSRIGRALDGMRATALSQIRGRQTFSS